MSSLERAIARQRRALLEIEQNGARQIISAYQAVEARLKENLDLLTREIAHGRASGIEVKPGWLFAQERYRALLAELQRDTLAFLHQALAAITAMQSQAVKRAPDDAERLIFATLGPAPKQDIAHLRGAFGKLPAAALREMIGRASNGQPLGDLLSEIVPDAVEAVRNSLAYGVATGQNPRLIADDVIVRSGMSRTRALAIARTETLGSYRAVTKERFLGSRIVSEWEWLAALDARTCPACAAMNGTRHSITEPLASHPACRCVMSPLTPSWAELGFTGIPDGRPPALSPEQRFEALSEADRLAILGRARLDAYNAGKITLADMVAETYSPRWGNGRSMVTLTALGLRV
jgi:SPP1 gp7 family putative phage head morphogenesis protein